MLCFFLFYLRGNAYQVGRRKRKEEIRLSDSFAHLTQIFEKYIKITEAIKNLFLFLSAAIIFIGCNNTTGKVLSFPVGTDYEFIGVVPYHNEVCLGFAKKQFNPNLKIFNEQGILKDSIPLAGAEKILTNITDIWMISHDSICVYSNYNGTLVVLGGEGVPLFVQSYYHIEDENGYHYDLLPSHPLYPFITNKYKDVIFSTWMWSGESSQSPAERLDDVRRGFLLCRINAFHKRTGNEEAGFKFGFNFSDIEEFSQMKHEPVFFAPYHKAYIVNEKIMATSFYSRYMYLLSENLSVEKTFKIIDDESSIIRPIPMEKEGSIQDKANETMAQCLNAVFVANVLYDEVKGNYLVILKNGEMKSSDWDHFPFKVQVYNQDFKKIGEHEFYGSDYAPKKSFILSGNLYMEKENESSLNKKDYEIIEI